MPDYEYIRTEPAYKVYEASLMAKPITLAFFLELQDEDREITAIYPRKFNRPGYLVQEVGQMFKTKIDWDQPIKIYRAKVQND